MFSPKRFTNWTIWVSDTSFSRSGMISMQQMVWALAVTKNEP